MEMEIWRPVLGRENLYEVSNYGRVRSLDTTQIRSNGHTTCAFHITGRILKPFRTGKGPGYLTVQVGHKQNKKVHRLVAEAFLPNPLCLPEVNHIDGDKTNNRLTNLEWVTSQDNIIHGVEHGLFPKGEAHKSAKLSASSVREIRSEYKRGVVGAGIKSLAKKYGVTYSTIRDIVLRKKWRWVE